MKYLEIIADNLAKPVGVGAVSQPLIVRGERSGLLTQIATMGSVSLCVRMKKLTAFVELERAIYEFAVDLIS